MLFMSISITGAEQLFNNIADQPCKQVFNFIISITHGKNLIDNGLQDNSQKSIQPMCGSNDNMTILSPSMP